MQTTGRSSGRQEPLNCHCEGLLIEINKSVFYCLYFCESHWPPSALHAIVIFHFPSQSVQTCFLLSIPRSARLNKSIGFGLQVYLFAHRGFIIFVRFVSDSWKRKRVETTAIYFVSCAGWNFRMNFTLFICSFFIEAVRQIKN